jgi:hypothetical protein
MSQEENRQSVSVTRKHTRGLLLPDVPERDNIKQEILSTEKKYLESLDILNNIYLTPLIQKKLLISTEINDLILVLNIIMNFSKQLVKNIESSIETDNLGEKFLIVIPFLKTYTDYFNKYEKVSTIIRNAKQENKKFAEWLIKTEKKCRIENKLNLGSYMVMPCQRIPRYNLLLSQLLRNTDDLHKDYNNIKKALDGTVSLSDFLNKKIKEIKSDHMKERLMSILQFEHDSERDDLIKPHRKYVHEGILEVVESSNRFITPFDINDNHYYVLMNDRLLVCEKIEEEQQIGITLTPSSPTQQSTASSPVELEQRTLKLVHQISLLGDIPWIRTFGVWKPLLLQLHCSEGNILFKSESLEEHKEWISQFNYVTSLLTSDNNNIRKAKCRLQASFLQKDAALMIQSRYRGTSIRKMYLQSKK